MGYSWRAGSLVVCWLGMESAPPFRIGNLQACYYHMLPGSPVWVRGTCLLGCEVLGMRDGIRGSVLLGRGVNGISICTCGESVHGNQGTCPALVTYSCSYSYPWDSCSCVSHHYYHHNYCHQGNQGAWGNRGAYREEQHPPFGRSTWRSRGCTWDEIVRQEAWVALHLLGHRAVGIGYRAQDVHHHHHRSEVEGDKDRDKDMGIQVPYEVELP